LNIGVKTAVALGVIASLSILLNPVPAQAQNELRVVSSSAQALFPDSISFELTAESDVDITDIRLHYTVIRSRFADVTSEIYLEFESSTAVEVVWSWDMRRTGGLPPGVNIQYWWTVKDEGGNKIETSPAILKFSDERYSWQSLRRSMVTLYWYGEERSFADEIMLAIGDSLDWLEEDTGAVLLEPIEIYLYANSQDLQGSMIFPHEWTGGVTYPEYRCIVIGFGPEDFDWGKRVLVHELTHMVVHQITSSPYGGMPTWLDEGLAMRSEGPLAYYFVTLFDRAIANDSLISVQSISSPFSAVSELSYLSYAESYYLIDYLITTYGKDKMFSLLETFGEGASYDGALMEVYDFDTSDLNQQWQEYLSPPVEQAPEPEEESAETVSEGKGINPALAGTLAALVTAVLLLLSLATERWTWRRG
jgi:hypothetical protein